MKKYLILLALGGMMLPAAATDMEFSYNIEGRQPEYYGTSKRETYDIAVMIDNPSLTGAEITSLSVILPGEPDLYKDCSAFLTTELKIERINGKRVNAPDICSVPATLENGKLVASFDEPYKLTGTPIFVGYTIDVDVLTEASKLPIAVVPGKNPNGFWFHSSSTQLKWANYTTRTPDGLQSAMTIGLNGDFDSPNAAVELEPQAILLSGQDNDYSFSVVNGGTHAIDSIEFDWSVAGMKGTVSYSFETPVNNVIGAKGTVTFTLPSCEENGNFPIEITLTKINGTTVSSDSPGSTADVIFAPAIPVMRPLVEEYTGLWCGWCPRGYAALEYLDEEYGHETFVAAAWHSDDPMEVVPMEDYPNSVFSWPLAFINRDKSSLDPGNIDGQWSKARAIPTDLDISCNLSFSEASKSAVTATASVTSLTDKEEQYRIGYLLVADGLEHSTWFQSNNYSSKSGTSLEKAEADLPGRFAALFNEGHNPMPGLVFNDVVVNAEHAEGVRGSLPDNLTAFRTYTHEVTFDLDDIYSIFDKSEIPVIKGKVRVLAFLLKKNGMVANSCSSGYPSQVSLLDSVSSEAEVVSTIWYDLQGHSVAAPAKGLYIRMDTLSDGSLRVTKALFR